MIDKIFIYCTDKDNFTSKLEAGEIKDTNIVFINDEDKEIWTQNTFFPTPKYSVSVLTQSEYEALDTKDNNTLYYIKA